MKKIYNSYLLVLLYQWSRRQYFVISELHKLYLNCPQIFYNERIGIKNNFFFAITIVKIKRYKWAISDIQSYIRLDRIRRKTIFFSFE